MADLGAGWGVVIGVGEGALLGVAEDPEVELVGNFLGTVPEVDAIGDEGVVLGLEEDDDEEGSAALAEILAFGFLIFAAVVAADAGEGLAAVALVGRGCAWPGMNSTMASPPGTVNQLNLNSGTVFGSPVRSV